MAYRDDSAKLAQYRAQIGDLRRKMREVQAAIEPQEVSDYELTSARGPVRLSALFGGHDTLIVIHNMGTSCTHCTMWADGFNGVFEHLRSRAAFVVVSPDPPDVQQKFAAGRGWRFPMVSHRGSKFAADLGYERDGKATPGVSVFKRDGKTIMRVADAGFSPGDDFCTVWHMFDLIPEGAAGWRPKFKYAEAKSP